MYKCPSCGAIFEEPDYVEIDWEDYNGVSSWFVDRHKAVFAECPECSEAINIEYDAWDEEYEDEDDEDDE